MFWKKEKRAFNGFSNWKFKKFCGKQLFKNVLMMYQTAIRLPSHLSQTTALLLKLLFWMHVRYWSKKTHDDAQTDTWQVRSNYVCLSLIAKQHTEFANWWNSVTDSIGKRFIKSTRICARFQLYIRTIIICLNQINWFLICTWTNS